MRKHPTTPEFTATNLMRSEIWWKGYFRWCKRGYVEERRLMVPRHLTASLVIKAQLRYHWLHRNIAILHLSILNSVCWCARKHPTTTEFTATNLMMSEIWWKWYVGWRKRGYVEERRLMAPRHLTASLVIKVQLGYHWLHRNIAILHLSILNGTAIVCENIRRHQNLMQLI